MPKHNELDAVKQLREKGMMGKILLLTSYTSEDLVIESILCGFNGILLKDWETEEIVQAIQNPKRTNNFARFGF